MEPSKRIRVRMEKVKSLNYPPRCPCCLGSPAETPTPLVKGGAVVYTATWPHCEACAANERRRSRSLFLSQGLAVLGLMLLAIGAPVLFALHPVGPLDGPFCLALGAFLPILAAVLHKRIVASLPRPPGAVRPGAGVFINYGGAHLLGGGCVVDVTFLQESYAREFIDLNRAKIVKIRE